MMPRLLARLVKVVRGNGGTGGCNAGGVCGTRTRTSVDRAAAMRMLVVGGRVVVVVVVVSS